MCTDEVEVQPDGLQTRTKYYSYYSAEDPQLRGNHRLSQTIVIEDPISTTNSPLQTAYSEQMTVYGAPGYASTIAGHKQVVWISSDKVAAARLSSKARAVGLASKYRLTCPWMIPVGMTYGQKPPEKDGIGAVPFESLSNAQRKFIKECGLVDNDKTRQSYSSVLHYGDE